MPQLLSASVPGAVEADACEFVLRACAHSTLEGRLALLTREQSPAQLDTGVLDAPVGCVTVCFMNVVGAQVRLR